MILYSYLLDIVKYTVSGLGVVWIAFYLLKPYLDRSENMQLIELKKTISNQTLPLRLQAYERVVLFIERINPSNLLIRLNNPDYQAAELYMLIVAELRNEYQHNVTQQIYVSTNTWAIVKRLKDETLGVVNNAIKNLPETATGLELSKMILAQVNQSENNPYEIGLNLIRKELEELF
ncbi:hypothetical protein [Mucilaginibacter sp. UR6-11]|uniref:DUF7935 family protein n=1 Tax=Mucilaginibacter sp. UR6-11 TaxID=1435644 RepID=UPI001E37DA92|nr:hypothetical protein [Mucilaginibacter sp. UR6-11]MCC8425420.1 hypothetical protein [Mucilaginibacter sp. UR6-11]